MRGEIFNYIRGQKSEAHRHDIYCLVGLQQQMVDVQLPPPLNGEILPQNIHSTVLVIEMCGKVNLFPSKIKTEDDRHYWNDSTV